jgi:hypothetical protein
MGGKGFQLMDIHRYEENYDSEDNDSDADVCYNGCVKIDSAIAIGDNYPIT